MDPAFPGTCDMDDEDGGVGVYKPELRIQPTFPPISLRHNVSTSVAAGSRDTVMGGPASNASRTAIPSCCTDMVIYSRPMGVMTTTKETGMSKPSLSDDLFVHTPLALGAQPTSALCPPVGLYKAKLRSAGQLAKAEQRDSRTANQRELLQRDAECHIEDEMKPISISLAELKLRRKEIRREKKEYQEQARQERRQKREEKRNDRHWQYTQRRLAQLGRPSSASAQNQKPKQHHKSKFHDTRALLHSRPQVSSAQ